MKTGHAVCGCTAAFVLAVTLWFTGAGAAAGRVTPLPRALARARAFIGGEARLHDVTGLEVIGERTRSPGSHAATEPFEFRVLFPDCFQMRAGTVLHTIVGDRFWQRPTFSADIEATARRSTRHRFAREAVTFLLTPPPGLAMTISDAGRQTLGSLTGVSVAFRGQDGIAFELLIDAGSGQPLAIVSDSMVVGGPGAGIAKRVLSLQDYREIDGIKFPFLLDEGQGESRAVTQVRSIVLNKTQRAEFAPPSGQ